MLIYFIIFNFKKESYVTNLRHGLSDVFAADHVVFNDVVVSGAPAVLASAFADDFYVGF